MDDMTMTNRQIALDGLKTVNLHAEKIENNQLQMYTLEDGNKILLDVIHNDDGYLAMYGLGWTREMEAIQRKITRIKESL